MRLDLNTVARVIAEAVKEHTDPLAAEVAVLRKQLADVPVREGAPGPAGPAGAPGKDAPPVDVEAVIKTVMAQVDAQLPAMIPPAVAGMPGPAGPDGVPGKDAPPVDVEAVIKTVMVLVDAKLPAMIPPAVAGVPGRDGKDGRDAVLPDLDAFVFQALATERVRSCIADMVRQSAPAPLPPTDLQVIEAVKVLYPTIRSDLVKRLPPMVHRGVWSPEMVYDVGDEVIRNGSTYRLMEPSTDAPPSDAWQMTSQGKLGKKGAPGKDGAPGPEGRPGRDGSTIKDVVMAGGSLVIEMTDGSVMDCDMTPFIDEVIRRIGEG